MRYNNRWLSKAPLAPVALENIPDMLTIMDGDAD